MRSSRAASTLSFIFLLTVLFLLSAVLSYFNQSGQGGPAANQELAVIALSPTATLFVTQTTTSFPTELPLTQTPSPGPSTTPFLEDSPLKPVLVDTVEFSPYPVITRSPDGSIIGLMSNLGDTYRFQWFNAQTMQELGTFEVENDNSIFPEAIFSPDNTKVNIHTFDQIHLVNIVPGSEYTRTDLDASTYSDHFVFSHNSKFFACIYSDSLGFGPDQFGVFSLDGTSFAGYDHTGYDDPTYNNFDHPYLTDLAISPDDRMILVGNTNGIATLWDVYTGKVINLTHSSSVQSVAFSPYSKYAITSCMDGLVRMWDVSSGVLKRTVNGLAGTISSLEFYKNDSRLWVGIEDYPDQVVDLDTGQVSRSQFQYVSPEPLYTASLTKELYLNWPFKALVSPDGRYLYTYDQDIQVWDIQERKVTRLLINPYAHQSTQQSQSIEDIVLSPDGKYLAVVLSGDPVLYLQSTETGSILVDFDVSRAGLGNSVVFSPDSQFLAYLIGNRIEIHKVTDGSLFNTIFLSDLAGNFRFSFSSDGRKLFVVHYDGLQIQTWDVSTASQLSAYQFSPIEWSISMQYSMLPSSSLVDTVHIINLNHYEDSPDYYPQDTKIFNLENNTFVNLEGLSQNLGLGQLDADGNVLVSFLSNSELEGSLVFWRLDTGAVIYEMKNIQTSNYLFLTNGYLIILYGENLEIWDVHAIVEAANTIALPTDSSQLEPTPQTTALSEKDQPVLVPLENISQATEQASFGDGVVTEVHWTVDGESILVSSSLGVDQLTYDLQLSSRVAADGQVTSSALTEDGSLLIAEMIDNHAVVKRTGDNETLLDLAGYQYPVLSPDGRFTAFLIPSNGIAKWDLEVWNLEKGQPVSLLHTNSYYDSDNQGVTIRFSLDGKYVATQFEEDDLRIWDAADGGIVNAPRVINQPGKQFNFSPDGKYVVLVTQGDAWIFPIHPGDDPIEFHFFENTKENLISQPEYFNEVTAAALSPDNRIFAVGTTLHEITLFDRVSQKEIYKLTGIPSFPAQILFSPDGKTLLVIDRDGDLLTWDVVDGKLLNTNRDHTAAIAGLFFNAQGEVQAWENNTAWVLQPQTAEIQQTFTISQGTIAAFSLNKQWLAIYEPYSVSIWDAPSGKMLQALKEEFTTVDVDMYYYSEEKRAFYGAAFSPDDRYFVMAGTGNLWLYDTSNWKVNREIESKEGFSHPVFGSQSDRIYVFQNVRGPDPLNIYALNREDDPQFPDVFYRSQIGISLDGKFVAGDRLFDDRSGNYSVTDIQTGKTVAAYLFYDDSYPTSSAFSPDGHLVAIGQEDGTIYLLNLETDEVDMEFVGHRGAVTHLAFSPDGLTLASGGADGTIRFWDVGE